MHSFKIPFKIPSSSEPARWLVLRGTFKSKNLSNLGLLLPPLSMKVAPAEMGGPQSEVRNRGPPRTCSPGSNTSPGDEGG